MGAREGEVAPHERAGVGAPEHAWIVLILMMSCAAIHLFEKIIEKKHKGIILMELFGYRIFRAAG